MRHPWPGLSAAARSHVIASATAIVDRGCLIEPEHFPEEFVAQNVLRSRSHVSATAQSILAHEAEMDIIEKTIKECGGNISATARLLKIHVARYTINGSATDAATSHPPLVFAPFKCIEQAPTILCQVRIWARQPEWWQPAFEVVAQQEEIATPVQHTPGASAVVDLCRRPRCATATLVDVLDLAGMNSPQEQEN